MNELMVAQVGEVGQLTRQQIGGRRRDYLIVKRSLYLLQQVGIVEHRNI